MIENVTFGLSITTLLAVMAFVAYQVKKHSNELEKTIETIKPIELAKWLLLMLGVAFLFTAIIFIRYFTFFYGGLSYSNGDWGTFGDFIGGTLNPILSFLSLIALLATIVLQSKELELTRKELTRGASAQEDTKKILDQQSETLERQQFESTFFSLLDQHNKLLENLTTNSNGSKWTKVFYMIDEVNKLNPYGLKYAKELIESKNHICGHYFRVLYQLLKFIATNSPRSNIRKSFEAYQIENEKVSEDEKMYSNIVRSFLGNEIVQLLAINCYCKNSEDSYWKYKLLIERYAFLEHMPFLMPKEYKYIEKILVETKTHYKPSAFGNSDFLKDIE